MDNSVKITGIIVLGLVVLGFLISSSLNNLNPNPANTVSVSGAAMIKAIPDVVSVYFSIDTKGETSAEATSKNADIVNELKQNLIAEGFSEDQIQTQDFNVYPDYNYVNGQSIQNGYKATHTIVVRMPTSQSSKIGKSVDAGVNAGAGVSYINFELSQEKQNEYKAEAIKLAAQDARVKAQSVADGFNKNLGELVSTSVNDFNYVPWLAYASDGASASEVKRAATDINPSEQDISASVTAVYKLR